MPIDNLNIESKLKFSKRLGALITGHQQEMLQVLNENEDLQTLVEQLLKENATLKGQLAEEKTKNTQLQTEIEQLRNRPNIVTDTYIETQNVKQQCNYLPHSRRTSRYKLNNSTQTQLQLWNTPTATSM